MVIKLISLPYFDFVTGVRAVSINHFSQPVTIVAEWNILSSEWFLSNIIASWLWAGHSESTVKWLITKLNGRWLINCDNSIRALDNFDASCRLRSNKFLNSHKVHNSVGIVSTIGLSSVLQIPGSVDTDVRSVVFPEVVLDLSSDMPYVSTNSDLFRVGPFEIVWVLVSEHIGSTFLNIIDSDFEGFKLGVVDTVLNVLDFFHSVVMIGNVVIIIDSSLVNLKTNGEVVTPTTVHVTRPKVILFSFGQIVPFRDCCTGSEICPTSSPAISFSDLCRV